MIKCHQCKNEFPENVLKETAGDKMVCDACFDPRDYVMCAYCEKLEQRDDCENLESDEDADAAWCCKECRPYAETPSESLAEEAAMWADFHASRGV